MSSRQLKLIERIDELTILKAFGPGVSCLTLHELMHRNISPIDENIFSLIDRAAKAGIVLYRDDCFQKYGERDEECNVSLIRRSEGESYIEELSEKIHKAKLPAKNRVCGDMYMLYCNVMAAEIVHMTKAIGKLYKKNVFGPCRLNSSYDYRKLLTLRQMTGYIEKAVKLIPRKSWCMRGESVLRLATELMTLGKRYDFDFDEIRTIEASRYIQNNIVLNDYLYDGKWSLDQELILPLFRHSDFPVRTKN